MSGASYWNKRGKPIREPRNVMRIGERYGKLVVVEPTEPTKTRIKQWLCLCDCGGTKVVRHDHLRESHTVSCGCARMKKDKAPKQPKERRMIPREGTKLRAAYDLAVANPTLTGPEIIELSSCATDGPRELRKRYGLPIPYIYNVQKGAAS